MTFIHEKDCAETNKEKKPHEAKKIPLRQLRNFGADNLYNRLQSSTIISRYTVGNIGYWDLLTRGNLYYDITEA